MNKQRQTIYEWETRMVDCASKRVGAPVQLIKWDRKSNGIDVPIFSVPKTHKEIAIKLGLRVHE
jgi:hypothetical protein